MRRPCRDAAAAERALAPAPAVTARSLRNARAPAAAAGTAADGDSGGGWSLLKATQAANSLEAMHSPRPSPAASAVTVDGPPPEADAALDDGIIATQARTARSRRPQSLLFSVR
jgi:hypothetical protein